MNSLNLKKPVAILMVVLVIFGPMSEVAQSGDEEYKAGRLHGEREAKGESGWIIAGLLLGPIGITLAYLLKPSAYAGNIENRSPEYTRGYREGYRERTVKYNVDAAATGFLGFMFVLFWFSMGQSK